MKNSWLGYLASALLLVAGMLMIFGGKWIGAFFIVLAIAGTILRLYMSRKEKP